MYIHHTKRLSESALSSYSKLNLKTLFKFVSQCSLVPTLKAVCAMLEMSWITAISLLYSQVTDLLGNIIFKRISIRLLIYWHDVLTY